MIFPTARDAIPSFQQVTDNIKQQAHKIETITLRSTERKTFDKIVFNKTLVTTKIPYQKA